MNKDLLGFPATLGWEKVWQKRSSPKTTIVKQRPE